jgi:hypothetical protein
MRATKITKYFECENKSPLYYIPKNNSCRDNSCRDNSCRDNSCRDNSCRDNSCKINSCKNEKINTDISKPTSSICNNSSIQTTSSISNVSLNNINSFDSINIQLETKYYQVGTTIEYELYFNNNSQLDIKGTITNVGNAIAGDLMALHEALKYIVYHPNMSQKLNRYKFNIYTNSKTILGIYKPDSSYMSSNLYFKIQSLLKCIKNVSFELWHS